jgi:hypothetical protein
MLVHQQQRLRLADVELPEQQQQQQQMCGSRRTNAVTGPDSQHVTPDSLDLPGGQQQEGTVLTPLQPQLQQLAAFSTAWGQQLEGGAMPPPLGMPHKKNVSGIPAGPRVLWWWPCRPLDRVSACGGLTLSTLCMMGLTSSLHVQVSVWGLCPTNSQAAAIAAAERAGRQQVQLPPQQQSEQQKQDEVEVEESESAWLAATAHGRVPGAWRLIHTIHEARLSGNQQLRLAPWSAVQCFQNYPGWNLLRMELVRGKHRSPVLVQPLHISIHSCARKSIILDPPRLAPVLLFPTHVMM